MVSAVRRGKPLREVARRFRVSVSTVHYWVHRAEGQRLSRVNWRDRSHRPHHIRRTKRSIENLILKVRTELKDVSTLGEYGAQAIRGELALAGWLRCASRPAYHRTDLGAARCFGCISQHFI